MKKKKDSLLHTLLTTTNPFLRALYIAVGVGFVGFGLSLLWVAFTPIPDLDSFGSRKVPQSTKIYDRTGETVLYDLNPDVRRQIIPLSEMSPNIIHATIAIEDKEFYSHMGISITGIVRSIITDISTMSLAQGGSTLTQQVVKNTLLTREKSFIRKAHEVILAIKLEQIYTKDEILELYLNYIPYGGVFYGAESSSRAFFAKSAKDLSIAEAAYLAALPQSPTYYSPYGNHRADLDIRKNLVLKKMLEQGYISQDEYDEAAAEKVVFSPARDGSIIAPHFVFYIREYLEEKYGADVVSQGLSVVTTLDADLQRNAESIVNEYALSNATRFNASNAALIATDPKTGQILAMVGSRNYFDPDIDGNFNATLALRQPGSSFKPFVYAAALSKGFTPQTAILDVPTQFSTSCAPTDLSSEAPCYAPGNYDDKFRGPMTFTTALAQSINIPAVKALYIAGIQNVIDLGRRMGLTTLSDARDYGLSFALGAAEVKLLELTNAYGTFANEGIYNAPTGILKVTDPKGKVLEEFKDQPKQVLDPGVARDISSMLSNNEARQPEYPPVNPLYFPGYDVAVKTGTTNDYRDAWTVGYTPTIAVGVWAGNNNNSPMVKEIAGYIVAPMWNAFMQKALVAYPKEYFGEPRAVSPDAPAVLRGEYADGSGWHSILHWVNKDNPLGFGNSRGDGQYPYWEAGISNWSTQAPSATTTLELISDLQDELEKAKEREANN
ncbi:PBP1A family penicillin-binding protein [Patescibacteria group bacterium]|nr:PBP1A family penicillin-binding protein [Patescibacteria group bacterium]MBU1754772.1 PBP1A family penicillin-binding protein [Patescibacteria group bacterium]